MPGLPGSEASERAGAALCKVSDAPGNVVMPELYSRLIQAEWMGVHVRLRPEEGLFCKRARCSASPPKAFRVGLYIEDPVPTETDREYVELTPGPRS